VTWYVQAKRALRDRKTLATAGLRTFGGRAVAEELGNGSHESWPGKRGRMKVISEYITAKGSSANSLDISVNDLLRLGYQPFGQPYLSEGEEYYMCQAMVRYEEVPEPELETAELAERA